MALKSTNPSQTVAWQKLQQHFEKMKNIQKVYVGKANKCFCGCSGKWFDANNSDDSSGFLKGINKFNKLGADNGDDSWDVSYPDKNNVVVALYYQ